MKTFKELVEKTLTPAELKKREEIAKAMERENPGMDMGKKMAIATAAAKRVAEDVDEAYMSSDRSKQMFKRKELDHELRHEVEPKRAEPAEPHAVHINGKKWKTFSTKSHATNVAKKIAGATVVKESLDEATDHHDEAMEHKNKADKAMDKNDMEAYHHHMSAHHESMGQWHESKGRSSNADKEFDKAEKHHELSLKKNEGTTMLSFKYFQQALAEAKKKTKESSAQMELAHGEMLDGEDDEDNETIAQQKKEMCVKETSYSAKSAAAGKDIGKPGKMFDVIAKKAGQKYGSAESGRKVAGAILKNLRAKNEEVEIEEQAPVAPVPGTKSKTHAIMVHPESKQRVTIPRKNIKNYPASEGWKEVAPGMKESVELEELSKKPLLSYLTKATKQEPENIAAITKANDPAAADKALSKFSKRSAGMDRAVSKMYAKYDKPTSESVEELEELSKNTLKSYSSKAWKDADDRAEHDYLLANTRGALRDLTKTRLTSKPSGSGQERPAAAERLKKADPELHKHLSDILDKMNVDSKAEKAKMKKRWAGMERAKRKLGEELEEAAITHVVAKDKLAAHKEFMDKEGFDVKTNPLPKSHPKHATHMGIVSKNSQESSYHEDGNAHSVDESVELDEGDELAMRHKFVFNKTAAGKAREVARNREELKSQMKRTKEMGGITGPRGKLPEEVEIEEALKGDMHPRAGDVLKHIDPKHHDKYKPYLKNGVYKGNYSDRAAVLAAAEKAGHTVNEAVSPFDWKAYAKAKGPDSSNKTKTFHDVKKTSTGTVYTKQVNPDGTSKGSGDDAAKSAEVAAAPKRGRGRPAGVGAKTGSYKPRDPAAKAASAAKAAASKAANRAMRKEEFDNEFMGSLIEGFEDEDFDEFLYCEEFDELDEATQEALINFINEKSCGYKMKESLVGGQKKLDKNKNGKLDREDFRLLRKEAEEIEELSKKTLGSYVKSAAKDAEEAGRDQEYHGHKNDYKRGENRQKGIEKAVNRLMKEETEQIQESVNKYAAFLTKKQ